MTRKRKFKKQQKKDDFIKGLSLLYWSLSDERRTQALCDDIISIGNTFHSTILALTGKEGEKK